MRGGDPDPLLEFARFNIADITGNEKNKLFFIFVHFHSYTSRLDPPPRKKFLDPRL